MTPNRLFGLLGCVLLLAAYGLAVLDFPRAAASDDRRLDYRLRAHRGLRLDLAGVVARIRSAGY